MKTLVIGAIAVGLIGTPAFAAMKTAKSLGINISGNVLSLADE